MTWDTTADASDWPSFAHLTDSYSSTKTIRPRAEHQSRSEQKIKADHHKPHARGTTSTQGSARVLIDLYRIITAHRPAALRERTGLRHHINAKQARVSTCLTDPYHITTTHRPTELHQRKASVSDSRKFAEAEHQYTPAASARARLRQNMWCTEEYGCECSGKIV